MKADIEKRIRDYFPDAEKVSSIFEKLTAPEEERDRVIRCILYLSDNDYDSVEYWVSKANEDRRDVYFYAEYDNRSERRWNFNVEFDKQCEYEYRNK
jgi:hypothetical protein